MSEGNGQHKHRTLLEIIVEVRDFLEEAEQQMCQPTLSEEERAAICERVKQIQQMIADWRKDWEL